MEDTFELQIELLEQRGIKPDDNDFEEQFEEEFNIDVRDFEWIIDKLLNMIDFAESQLTNKKYKGFSKDNKKYKTWLVKKEV